MNKMSDKIVDAEIFTKESPTIYEKLLKVQEAIKPIVKDSTNPHFKNTYFDINTLLEKVKPILNENGLLLLQPLGYVDGKNALNTLLIEVSTGRTIAYACLLPEGLEAQKMGAAITYFRRYALQSMLGLEAEDDDGESAKKPVVKAKIPYPTPASEGINIDEEPF